MPLWRPLWLELPREPAAWESRGAWLLGPDVMIVPAFEPDARRRLVYLPPGSWKDLRDPDGAGMIDGDGWRLVGVPAGSITLLERANARWSLRRHLPRDFRF